MGIRILHHNDMDGRCAGHIALRFYEAQELGDIALEEVDYNSQPQDLNIYKGHDIVVLDYSFSKDKMVELKSITRSLIWIDHHKTSIEKIGGIDILGLRSENYAACVLTYMFYHSMIKSMNLRPENEIIIDEVFRSNHSNIPYAILLVGDRDTWAFKYGNDTRYFNDGFYYTEDSKPSSRAWDRAISNSLPYIEKGAELKVVIDKIYGDQMEKSGFWVDWEGYHCFCINSASPSSEALERAQPLADIHISFRWSHGMFAVSLYTTKPGINVSEIAKKYKWNGVEGGGHIGAAGFQCSFPPFLLR